MQPKIRGYKIFSGYTFLFVFWIVFFLSTIENKLGWGLQYKVYVGDYISLYIVYTITFIFGIFIANFYYREKAIRQQGKISIKYVKLVYYLVFFFMILKFINIRDIPLLGDPMSRYNYTLGGFADYPSRFLPIVAMSSFYLYRVLKKKEYLYYTLLALLFPMLLMQRQDVVIGVLGIIIVISLNRDFSLKKITQYSLIIIASIVVLVGGGAIIRYGSQQLSGTLSMSELLIAVIHGDLSAASIFGAYVVENIREFYYGMYSLGEYFSILSPTKVKHGAELMRMQFTESETAQSIAIPFSFYVDFGYWGIALFASISGFLLQYFLLKYKRSGNIFYGIIYAVFFLELFWSIRSGSIPFRPIFVYQFLLLFFIFAKSKKHYYTLMLKPFVLLMFFVSLVTALIRF